ncbi:magnesium transporter [Turicibacter sanguinis]|jgi:magnesium transporter|uniref:magnesium transporter n=1 Tax=Turicibacter sanguinis TaxID=154288 RepID=UPI0012BA21A4|nr:magnesium transporter [Turicibacter sanguinis]MDB8554577.1 magnesium transporter [Turicibacter sanguinis]MDB8557596.1 magnesium transporter [Turicibacter sanguinis]MDB8560366.1 magnesium transporter [Turicibacter sanguinis]MTH07697.1 magnesium transporter [Turicibacter sanguinis]MTH08535.1 magnesium transporter [Turicibacter sanguinis]
MVIEIKELIERNKLLDLCEYLQELNSVDVANQLMDLDDEELVLVFRILPKDIAAEVFSYLDKESQQHIVESITDREVTQIVDKLFLDDTVDFIGELPANVVKKVIRNTSPQKRELINQFLKYAEYSAGSIMTIEFVDLKAYMTVKEAINHTRKTGTTKETLETCFIIDQARHLLGSVTLKDLILSEDDMIIEDIMDTNLISVQTSVDQEEVAHLFKAYDLVTMPVVDKENRLVGMITIDDVVDIIEQENTEDFQKMAAMAPNEEPYLKTPVLSLAKHRIIWLLVLMISATVTGRIIQGFEEVIQSVVILASFIPMLMDTGGNAGSQSSTLIIRGLALGEITTHDYLKVMFKELRVGSVVAIVLSVVNFLRIYFIEHVEFMVGITVCASLFFTVILAKVVGSILPIIAKKLKFDPAIMASPLITTIVDAFALIVYFMLARTLLGI